MKKVSFLVNKLNPRLGEINKFPNHYFVPLEREKERERELGGGRGSLHAIKGIIAPYYRDTVKR